MAGLLDGLLGGSMDDPRTAATLQLAQGLLSAPRGMQGLSGGLLGYQQAMQESKKQKAAEEYRALQMQQQQMQIQQAQAAQAKQQAIDQAYRGAMRSPQQLAMAANGGPTNAAAQAAPNMAPSVDQSALIQALSQADPQAAYQMLQPKPADYKVVGNALLQVGPGGVKEAYRAPDKPDLNSLIMIGPDGKPTLNQALLDAKRQIAQAGATRLTVDQRGDNAYATAQGKEYSDQMAGINKAGFNAPSQLRKLERMEELLTGVDGGKLAPVGLEVASWANSMGVKLDPKLGNKEAAQALSRELAGGLRQPGTGPMTDKDFENFLQQIPDLSKSADGRKRITATMKAALNRDMKVAKMAREYEKRNGRIDGAFMDEVAAYIAENPVIAAPSGWAVKR